MLSKRGESYKEYSVKYMSLFAEKCAHDIYSETNPNGYINLSVAENNLVFPTMMKEKISEICQNLPDCISRYTVFTGNPECRKTVASIMEKFFFEKKINPENLIVTNGLGAAIDMLCHVLFDEGDAVILPTPNYSYLKIDITLRPKVEIIYTPMDMKNLCDVTRLEEAWNKAKADGINVRGLFLTSPVNPTGTCLTKQQLEEALDWCDKKGIHCIVDEIYALSVYNPVIPFTSASFYYGRSPSFDQRLHVLYGMSKDFAISGFRVGLVYTENQDVIKSCRNIMSNYMTSTITQYCICKLFSNGSFVEEYVKQSNKALKEAYEHVKSHLEKYGIPYIEPHAGFFVWVNLRKYLEEDSTEGEQKLWEKMLFEAKVNFSCGYAFFSNEPGWFRICFANVNKKEIDIAFDRLAKIFKPVKMD